MTEFPIAVTSSRRNYRLTSEWADSRRELLALESLRLRTAHAIGSNGASADAQRVNGGNGGAAATWASNHSAEPVALDLVAPDAREITGPTLIPIQEWEGYVTDIREDEIEARLLDITAGDKVETLIATIPFDELSQEDRQEVTRGSVFRWVIGYRGWHGTRENVSLIYFFKPRRLTNRDLEEGRKLAEWLLEEHP